MKITFGTVFGDMWLNLVGDVKSLGKDVADQIVADNKPPEKHVYMSLPRPGVSLFIWVFIYTIYMLYVEQMIDISCYELLSSTKKY